MTTRMSLEHRQLFRQTQIGYLLFGQNPIQIVELPQIKTSFIRKVQTTEQVGQTLMIYLNITMKQIQVRPQWLPLEIIFTWYILTMEIWTKRMIQMEMMQRQETVTSFSLVLTTKERLGIL